MEPSPPRKPRRPNAFYEKPELFKTSAEIVNEAKEELLKQTRDKVRPLQTTRPFTPREDQRTLFNRSARYDSRPPSSFSLSSQHFDGSESRPPSAVSRPVSGTRLTPIDPSKLPHAADGSLVTPKPPPDPNRKRSGRGSRLHHQRSLDIDDIAVPRSGSLGDLKQHESLTSSRRVHSGPKERTTPLPADQSSQENATPTSLEERGEGDGQEVPAQTATSRDSSSAGKRGKDRSDTETMYYDTHIVPIVEELSTPGTADSRVIELSMKLYNALDEGHLLGKACKQRSAILKIIFKLIDRTDAQVLLSLARVILAFRVGGGNLSSVCKLIFKVSRDKNNDKLFLTTNILDLLFDSMVGMDMTASADSLIYSCGALKFLSGNKKLSQTLSQKVTLFTLSSILDKINQQNLDISRCSEKVVQILVQLTASLRRFAEQDLFTSQFISHNLLDKLCVTSVAFSGEYDLMLNISSTYSKLTVHSACCENLYKHPSCFRSLLKLLKLYTHKEDLILRLCFTLGNLAALSDESRLALYAEKDSIETLISVFEHYLELDIKERKDGRSPGGKSVNDVMIKLIRVIANLSITEDVGLALCDNKKCIEYLTHIIEVKDIVAHEELVLNTMATVNNLTYYSSPGTAIQDDEVDIAKTLMKMLLNDHKDGMLEACRIYGNLTRHKRVREFLTRNSVVEIMVTLLDSEEQELVYSCCGVLINFMCDEEKRLILKREGGVAKLVEVLHDFASSDWQLAGLVCQVLWNFSSKIRSSTATFGERESHQLVDILNTFIDDPHVPDGCSDEVRAYLHDTWQSEFCPVAAQFRKRVKSHQSQFEELEPPSQADRS